VLRFLLWRLLGLIALLAGLALVAWFINGGPGRLLRGETAGDVFHVAVSALAGILDHWIQASWRWAPAAGLAPAKLLLALVSASVVIIAIARVSVRGRRRYVRLRVEAYRADQASPEAVVTMFGALHKRLLRRWWRRLLLGQPSLALEVHHTGGSPHSVWLAIACPAGQERMVEAALQATYPNCRLCPAGRPLGVPPVVLRLKKHAEFIKRVKTIDRLERDREPLVNRLLTAMGACGDPAFVQIAMTPTPAFFEAFAKHLYKRHEARLSRAQRAPAGARPLDGRGCRAPWRPGGSAQTPVLRGFSRHRPESCGLRADRIRAAGRGGREPPRRARNSRAPWPARALRAPR
jgi:hypothetical protein